MKLIINERILDLSETQIMGILNVTPDSFYDGGEYYILSKAIDHASTMVTHGATLIDIGGESTRPGANIISDKEEVERVVPIVQAVAKRFDVFISVNTSSALVIRESALAGAHLINDIRSLIDKEAMKAAVDSNLLVCLVHMYGSPKTMQENIPCYSDIICEVNDYFTQHILRCELAGIDRRRLLIDPGFGFSKKLIHNYELLANLKVLHHFNLPILVGISRKSMLYLSSNQNNPQTRLIGSITAGVIAMMQKIQILRVHDVKETVEALQVVRQVLQYY